MDKKELQQYDVTRVCRFANINPFMRGTYQDSCEGLDIAMVGIPFDLGSSNRTGSRHGPAQMREMSRLIRQAHYATGVAPFEICRIADVGDAPVNPLDMAATLESVQTFFADVCGAGARPLVAGGDHTITLPVLRAGAAD